MAISEQSRPGLGSILGQPRAVAALRAAIERKRLHHALLFVGPPGVGKGTTALALAQALNCEAGPQSGGCGVCSSCEKIAARSHPDFVEPDLRPKRLKEDGKGTTQTVRALIAALGYAPHEGETRVVVLDPAHNLADQQGEAANALLKTLEEPPSRTQFVLVTSQPDRLPITIRSRCQRVAFQPLSDAVLEELLSRHTSDREAVALAASMADGSMTRALTELAHDAQLVERREHLSALVDGLVAPSLSARALFELSAALASDREAAESVCTALGVTLRDSMLLAQEKHRGGVRPVALAEARRRATRGLAEAPIAWLLSAAQRTEAARVALQSFVAPALVFEHLLLELRDLRPDARADQTRPGTRP